MQSRKSKHLIFVVLKIAARSSRLLEKFTHWIFVSSDVDYWENIFPAHTQYFSPTHSAWTVHQNFNKSSFPLSSSEGHLKWRSVKKWKPQLHSPCLQGVACSLEHTKHLVKTLQTFLFLSIQRLAWLKLSPLPINLIFLCRMYFFL